MEAESSNTKKIIGGLIGTAFVVFALYFFFFKSAEVAIQIDEYGNPVQAQVVGQDLIDLLAELQSVNLDASIFNSPLFINLNDFAIQLRDEPRGRKDPFEPLSGFRSTR